MGKRLEGGVAKIKGTPQRNTLIEYFNKVMSKQAKNKPIVESKLSIQVELRDAETVDDKKEVLEDIETSEEEKVLVMAKRTSDPKKRGTTTEATGKSKAVVEQSVYTNPDDTVVMTGSKESTKKVLSKEKVLSKKGQIVSEDSERDEDADPTQNDKKNVSKSDS
jgi:hypothetical protein